MPTRTSAPTVVPQAIASFTYYLFATQERKSDAGEVVSRKYGCSFLWPKGTDLSILEKMVLDTIVLSWGEGAAKWIKEGIIRSPFLDGDGPQAVNKKKGERHKGYADHWFIRATANQNYKPEVFDRDLTHILNSSGIPSGSRVIPLLTAFTWDNPLQGRGISFGIRQVQLVHKAVGDEILGGGGDDDPRRYFEVISDDASTPIPKVVVSAGASGLFG